MVFDELKKHLRNPVCVKGLTSRLSIHEAIKAQLYVLGYRLGYIPILEASTGTLKRIDCVYVKNTSIVCAIEIDYSIKKKSMAKLAALEESIEKIIISYGNREASWRAISRHKKNLHSIKHYMMHSLYMACVL